VAIVTKYYCDKCEREIDRNKHFTSFKEIAGVKLSMEVEVRGLVKGHEHVGRRDDASEVLLCRPCYGTLKEILETNFLIKLDKD
jgi:protein-arginine kinase activator protein McsA